MYASKNFKTKKAFKEAIAAGEKITLYQPNDIFGKGTPVSGKEVVEGPWYPAPHTWYAEVKIENTFVVAIK